MSRTLDEIIAPALDAYSTAVAKHGHTTYGAPVVGCICGWQPSRSTIRQPRRAVGIHIAAAEKRASTAYSAQVDELLEQVRGDGRR